MRDTPGSACPQPEPNATELPSCAPISARAAQRRRWRGGEGARRPGPEDQVLRHVLWNALRIVCAASFTCPSFMYHRRAGVGGGGSRPGRRAPQHTSCPLEGCISRILYMLALHEPTATVTGPAAPTKGFKRSKSAWRDDEETVDEEALGGAVGSRPPALAHTSSLDTDLTRNTRAPHFTPQHWLLCHTGLY